MTLLFGNMHLQVFEKTDALNVTGPSIIWASKRENDGYEKHRR